MLFNMDTDFIEINEINGFIKYLQSVFTAFQNLLYIVFWVILLCVSDLSRLISFWISSQGPSSLMKCIEWRDPWLMGLISFHIFITLTCLTTRNYGNFQIVLFFSLLLLVFFSESINEFASKNWTLFSRQQYFDSKGLFISIVFSVPILLNCMIMVGSWLYQSTQLMINLRKAQLKEQLKRQNSRNTNNSLHAKND